MFSCTLIISWCNFSQENVSRESVHRFTYVIANKPPKKKIAFHPGGNHITLNQSLMTIKVSFWSYRKMLGYKSKEIRKLKWQFWQAATHLMVVWACPNPYDASSTTLYAQAVYTLLMWRQVHDSREVWPFSITDAKGTDVASPSSLALRV